MIVGDMRHYEKERGLYPSAVQRGIDYIASRRLAEADVGRIELEGDRMFALVQETTTRPAAEQRPESHRKYVDIQYLVSGEEVIGVLPLRPDLPVVQDELDERDIAFYRHDGAETKLALQPGMFAVFFPSDVHRPCCCAEGSQGSPIRKVVVKIDLSLFV